MEVDQGLSRKEIVSQDDVYHVKSGPGIHTIGTVGTE